MILTGKYANYSPAQDHNLLVKLDANGAVSIVDGFVYIAMTSTAVKFRPLKNGIMRSASLILQVDIKKAWSMSSISNKHSLDLGSLSDLVKVRRDLISLLRPILIYLGFAKSAEFKSTWAAIRKNPVFKYRGQLPIRINQSIQLPPQQLHAVTDGLISYADEFDGDIPDATTSWACLADYQTATLFNAGVYAAISDRTGLDQDTIQAVFRGLADTIHGVATTVCHAGLKSAILEVPFLGDIKFHVNVASQTEWDYMYATDNSACDELLDITWCPPKSLARSVIAKTPLAKVAFEEESKCGQETK